MNCAEVRPQLHKAGLIWGMEIVRKRRFSRSREKPPFSTISVPQMPARRWSWGRTSAQSGFTLIEIMTAMAILAVGMSTIIGLLSFSLALHRSSDRKGEAAMAVDAAMRDLEERVFIPNAKGEVSEPKEVPAQPVPGHPDLFYAAKFVENPKLAGEYLTELEIGWKEKGRTRSQKFQTILIREQSFAQRMKKLPPR